MLSAGTVSTIDSETIDTVYFFCLFIRSTAPGLGYGRCWNNGPDAVTSAPVFAESHVSRPDDHDPLQYNITVPLSYIRINKYRHHFSKLNTLNINSFLKSQMLSNTNTFRWFNLLKSRLKEIKSSEGSISPTKVPIPNRFDRDACVKPGCGQST